jgi:diguanylate cyclase (GGDEF)-like protein
MHEGSIAVASELNRGTAFTIILPKMDSEAVFKQHIENGIQEVKAQNSHLSLITVRITQFVSLQQELGFEKAHKFITDIENVIIQAMRRKADTVVRDTGELIILLFDVNRKSAALVKERVSEVIQAYLKERRDAVSINVSFNIGLATFPEEAKSPEELLDKARGVVKVKAENA